MQKIRNWLAWPFMVLGATLIIFGSVIKADTINFNSLNLVGKDD